MGPRSENRGYCAKEVRGPRDGYSKSGTEPLDGHASFYALPGTRQSLLLAEVEETMQRVAFIQVPGEFEKPMANIGVPEDLICGVAFRQEHFVGVDEGLVVHIIWPLKPLQKLLYL